MPRCCSTDRGRWNVPRPPIGAMLTRYDTSSPQVVERLHGGPRRPPSSATVARQPVRRARVAHRAAVGGKFVLRDAALRLHPEQVGARIPAIGAQTRAMRRREPVMCAATPRRHRGRARGIDAIARGPVPSLAPIRSPRLPGCAPPGESPVRARARSSRFSTSLNVDAISNGSSDGGVPRRMRSA